MRKVLIISPYFPPSNTADMHRIRMSISFYQKFDWQPEVVTVDEKFSNTVKDDLLSETIPSNIKVHKVSAISNNITKHFGLNTLALRSIFHYFYYVNKLLSSKKFDLIFFSTTQFPITILGAYWKRKFKIPFVVDMQDPWYNNYYDNKPSIERPKKHWFSNKLNKFLEPITMNNVDGLITVSEEYVLNLKRRYKSLKNTPFSTITFGHSKFDFEIAKQAEIKTPVQMIDGIFNIVYVGVAGPIMEKSLNLFFRALNQLKVEDQTTYSKFRFHFLGTSYAPAGTGIPSVKKIAEVHNVSESVSEVTDRLSYFTAIKTMLHADALFIPGSDNPDYTASKIFPYILSAVPILAVFLENSSAFKIIQQSKSGVVLNLNSEKEVIEGVKKFHKDLYANQLNLKTDWDYFNEFSSENLTRKQTDLFNSAVIKFR